MFTVKSCLLDILFNACGEVLQVQVEIIAAMQRNQNSFQEVHMFLSPFFQFPHYLNLPFLIIHSYVFLLAIEEDTNLYR